MDPRIESLPRLFPPQEMEETQERCKVDTGEGGCRGRFSFIICEVGWDRTKKIQRLPRLDVIRVRMYVQLEGSGGLSLRRKVSTPAPVCVGFGRHMRSTVGGSMASAV